MAYYCFESVPESRDHAFAARTRRYAAEAGKLETSASADLPSPHTHRKGTVEDCPRKGIPKEMEMGIATTQSSLEKSIKEHVKRKRLSGIPVARAFKKKKTSKI